MATNQRRGGMIQVLVSGEVQDAKGNFSYSLGTPKRTTIIGSDRPHGYKEEPTVAYIEGKITDEGTLDLKAAAKMTAGTVTLQLANGKTISLSPAHAAGDWKGDTDEGEIDVRWESTEEGEEITS